MNKFNRPAVITLSLLCALVKCKGSSNSDEMPNWQIINNTNGA